MMEGQLGNGWDEMLQLACAAMQDVLGPSGAHTHATDTRPHLWERRLCEVAGLVRMTQAIKQHVAYTLAVTVTGGAMESLSGWSSFRNLGSGVLFAVIPQICPHC